MVKNEVVRLFERKDIMKKNIGMCVGHKNFDTLRKIRNIGYDFVEFNFSALRNESESFIKECADLLKELNMPCISMNCLLLGDFVLIGDDRDHSKVREHVEETLEKIQPLGTKTFVMGSGKARSVPDGYSREKAMEQIESLFCDVLAPAAKKYDSVIAIEELRKEECNIFVTCREVMEFIKKIDNPNVKLLIDYYHAMLGGDTLEEIASYKGYISHVHIASPLNGRIVPQPTDTEDYKGFFDALDKAEYTRANISLEGNWDNRFDELAKISHDYLRSIGI